MTTTGVSRPTLFPSRPFTDPNLIRIVVGSQVSECKMPYLLIRNKLVVQYASYTSKNAMLVYEVLTY